LALNIRFSKKRNDVIIESTGVADEQTSLICQKGYQFASTFVFHPLLLCLPVVAVLSSLTQLHIKPVTLIQLNTSPGNSMP